MAQTDGTPRDLAEIKRERVLSSVLSMWKNTGGLLGKAECVQHIALFLSLQIFFSVIRLAVFPDLPPLRLSSYLPERLKTGVLSPSMFTFQRDDFQVLEKDNSYGETDKRLGEYLYTVKRDRKNS